MILDIDHISICTTHIEQSIENLKSIGYKLRFAERNIKNPTIKKNFLSQFSEKHDLALLDSDKNFSIELINYGYSSNQQTPFSLFGNKKLSTLQGPSNTFSLDIKNIEKTITFWQLLGFKVIQQTSSFAKLKFTSFLKKCDYYLEFKKIKKVNDKCYLDGNGFNSIAFITTSLSKDHENFLEMGLTVTNKEKLFLNDKHLSIFFVKGLNGEIIELIEINQNKS